MSSRSGLSARTVLRTVAALAVTGAFVALPSAWAGESPGGAQLPACAAGQMPTQQAPCMPPICPDGVTPSDQNRCVPHCPQGVNPTQEHPCVPNGPSGPSNGGPSQDGPKKGDNQGTPSQDGPKPGGNQGTPPSKGVPGDGNKGSGGGDQQCAPPGDGEAGAASECGMPDFAPSFLSRVWRFTGDADNYDADTNILNMTVTKVLNLPKKMADQDDEIVDQDAYVVFSATTKVFDQNGKRLSRESKYDNALDNAKSVKIAGKIMPPKKWQKDEDDTPVTTIRAKQVTIVS